MANFADYLKSRGSSVKALDLKKLNKDDFNVNGFTAKELELSDDKESVIVSYEYDTPPKGTDIFRMSNAFKKLKLTPRSSMRNRKAGTWEVSFKA